MLAIYKREMHSFFTNPLGYVFIAVLMLFEGLEFYAILSSGSSYNFTVMYSDLFSYCMLLIPLLTMKLLSEDKKQKTDQALLTAPVSLFGLVFGKFLAALSVYSIAVGFTLVHAFVLSFFAEPYWGIILGNIVGTILYGAATIAIGLLISSLTDSQMIAALGTFGVSLFLLYSGTIASFSNNETVTAIGNGLSFYTRYYQLTTGILDFSSIIYFVSVAGVFLYLTVCVLEKKRWS